jgi:phosphocarrier protein
MEEALAAAATVAVTIEVTNPLGLHMRSANSIARAAQQFQADIWIWHGEARIDAKSILGVMKIASECGTRLQFEAAGPDAEAAIRSISGLDVVC